MTMPIIPIQKHRPHLVETIIDLLESVALEEMALSHILNAEAEKIQAFVGKDLNFPTQPTNKEIVDFDRMVTRLLDTVLFKEWMLVRKMELIQQIFYIEEIDELDDKDDADWDDEESNTGMESDDREQEDSPRGSPPFTREP